MTADGKLGYTANVADNSVSELDLVAGSFKRKFAVPVTPEGVAVTPDGREVWVGSNTTGEVSVISMATGAITHALPGDHAHNEDDRCAGFTRWRCGASAPLTSVQQELRVASTVRAH